MYLSLVLVMRSKESETMVVLHMNERTPAAEIRKLTAAG